MKTLKPAATQRDTGLGFDGAQQETQKNIRQRECYNHHTGRANTGATINKGRGPTRGNTGSLTDSSCRPPVSAVPSLPAQGSVRDSINRGAQVRNPGGTRAFDPSATQNYRGNSDKINVGRGPTKGNQC
jgi:hypothetical protein